MKPTKPTNDTETTESTPVAFVRLTVCFFLTFVLMFSILGDVRPGHAVGIVCGIVIGELFFNGFKKRSP